MCASPLALGWLVRLCPQGGGNETAKELGFSHVCLEYRSKVFNAELQF